MDDNINGAANVDDAFLVYKKSKLLTSTAGFTLRKWCSNSTEVMQRIENEESTENLNENTPITHVMSQVTSAYKSILGINYDIDNDELVYDFTRIVEMTQNKPHTKRNILSVVSSIYDPPGYVAPITSQGKVVFQLLCANKSKNDKCKWDDEIPGEIAVLWRRFIKLITTIMVIRLKRCVVPELMDSIVSIELHGFCDASRVAYAAVIYLRKETTSGVVVNFLTAKTKVAPLGKTSSPRLALLSCDLLTKVVLLCSQFRPHCPIGDTTSRLLAGTTARAPLDGYV